MINKEIEKIIDEIEDKFQLDILTNKSIRDDFVKLVSKDLNDNAGQELDIILKFLKLKKKYPNHDLYLLEYLDSYNMMNYVNKKWIAILGNSMTPHEVFASDNLENIEDHLERSKTTTQRQLMHLYKYGRLVDFKLKIILNEK